MTPLLGAYIADTHWGRYKTICVAVGIALLGHILLIISGIPTIIDEGNSMAPFIIALIVMGLGEQLLVAFSVLDLHNIHYSAQVPVCSKQTYPLS